MRTKKLFFLPFLFLLFFMCLVTSGAFAYNNTYEYIGCSKSYFDTSKMNERTDERGISGHFFIYTNSSNPDNYRTINTKSVYDYTYSTGPHYRWWDFLELFPYYNYYDVYHNEYSTTNHTIGYSAWVKWKRNGLFNWQNFDSGYWTPVSPQYGWQREAYFPASVASSKRVNFSLRNPEEWPDKIPFAIAIEYGSIPNQIDIILNGLLGGRGDIWKTEIEAPPEDNEYVSGNTDFERVSDFDSSASTEGNPITGECQMNCRTEVEILKYPYWVWSWWFVNIQISTLSHYRLGEHVNVFADINNKIDNWNTWSYRNATELYRGRQYASTWYPGSGNRPFKIPMSAYAGSHMAKANYAGEVEGCVTLNPFRYASTSWWYFFWGRQGSQQGVHWYLPPKYLRFWSHYDEEGYRRSDLIVQLERLLDHISESIPLLGLFGYGKKQNYTVYDQCWFGGENEGTLRKYQSESKVKGFTWNWGDPDQNNHNNSNYIEYKSPGSLRDSHNHIYHLNPDTVQKTYDAYFKIVYDNNKSKNVQTELKFPIKVTVKPLPYIYVASDIKVERVGGGAIRDDLAKEDYAYRLTPTGSGKRLISVEDDRRYSYEYDLQISDYCSSHSSTSTYTRRIPKNGSWTHYFLFSQIGGSGYTRTVKMRCWYHRSYIQNGELHYDGYVPSDWYCVKNIRVGSEDAKTLNRISFVVKPSFNAAVLNKSINTRNLFTGSKYRPDYYGYMSAAATQTAGLADQEVAITFNAEATIDYGGLFENEEEDGISSTDYDTDRFNGVATGSVYYRWRVLDPNGNDAIKTGEVRVATAEDFKLVSNFNTKPHPLPSSSPNYYLKRNGRQLSILTSHNYYDNPGPNSHIIWSRSFRSATQNEFPTGIKPITLYFRTPYGTTLNPNRYYKVFIEAKYQDVKWEKSVTGYGHYDESTGRSINGMAFAWRPLTSQQRYIVHTPAYTYPSMNQPGVPYTNTQTISMVDSYGQSNGDFVFYRNESSLNEVYRESWGTGEDVLCDGSIGYLVKINDGIPPKVVMENTFNGWNEGYSYTGDPVSPIESGLRPVVVRITDNNPDTIASFAAVVYDRFDGTSYAPEGNLASMTSFISDMDKKPANVMNVAIGEQGKFKRKLFEYTSTNIYDVLKNKNKLTANEKTANYPFMLASYNKYNNNTRTVFGNDSLKGSSFIAMYSNTKERFPDAFAITMNPPRYHGVSLASTNENIKKYSGKFTYYSYAFVDDGRIQRLDTDPQTFSVKDNDIPNIKVTLVNNESGEQYSYEILRGFNDPQSRSAYNAQLLKVVKVANNAVSRTSITEGPYNTPVEDINGLRRNVFEVRFDNSFRMVANQRLQCDIQLTDNVYPVVTSKGCASYTIDAFPTQDQTGNKFSGMNPKFVLRPLCNDDNQPLGSDDGGSAYRARSSNPVQFYLTTVGTTRLNIDVKDITNGTKYIRFSIPITVEEETTAKVRVLDQTHEKTLR